MQMNMQEMAIAVVYELPIVPPGNALDDMKMVKKIACYL